MGRAAILVTFLLAARAPGGELSVASIVDTIRFHPEGEPARVGLRLLSRDGEPGWTSLSGLVLEFAKRTPEVASAAARALAEGPEKARLEIVATTYKRLTDPGLRAVLVYALAFGFPEHQALVRKHMRENRPGATAILRVLAPKTLDERELRRYLETPDLAPIAYEALRGRGLRLKPDELVTWARAAAPSWLDTSTCAKWAKTPDFLFLSAVALLVEDREFDVRSGAHCLLMTVSGRKILPDPLLWKSWIAGSRAAYRRPEELSPGRIAAAVVRAARWLREDLAQDGRSLWRNDRDHAVGATSLSVLALLASGTPKNDPVISKAVRTALVVFDKHGRAAMPAISRHRETYELACLALALCELDKRKYRVVIEALRKRLVTGMLANGQWSYQCNRPTDKARPGIPDNSNTQYAVLALRAIHRAGLKVEAEAWNRIARYLYRSVNPWRGWSYRRTGRYSTGRQIAMTSAGIATLAITMEGLLGNAAAARIQADPVLSRARAYLGRLLMQTNYGNEEIYAYYSVERACVLTHSKLFKSRHRTFDWYLRGAKRLLDMQAQAGHWHRGHGPPLDTAWGVLFLTRATRTIGTARAGSVVTVTLPAKEDKPPPPPLEPEPSPPPPPRPPLLEVEWQRVATRNGKAEIAGRSDAPVLADFEPVPRDARGRFFLSLETPENRTVTLVAKGKNGRTTIRNVLIAYDLEPPRLRLGGAPLRHVGKQVVIFRATESLAWLKVAGRVYPADSATVRAAIDIRAGKRTLTAIAADRAGNQSRTTFEIEAVNRHLVLDGKSAIGVDLRERPERFTYECWVKGERPQQNMAVSGCTENSGFGFFWFSRTSRVPYATMRHPGGWGHINPKKEWDWSQWTHLAMCFDGVVVRYFVNGRLQGQAPATSPRSMSGHRLYIGADPDRHNNPAWHFKGAIDEVRLSRVARYEKSFRPARNFMRDRETLLLMHFDRDLVLDDSGLHHHGTTFGTPALDRAAPSVYALAERELRELLPAPQRLALLPIQLEEQNARARRSATTLHLLDVTVKVVSRNNVPLGGLEVSALHEALDVSFGPIVTNERGEATLRLPRGVWRVDIATHSPRGGRIVFARLRLPVRTAGVTGVTMDRRRQVRFRDRLGQARAAHAVTLAWPDLSYQKPVEVVQGQFEVLTNSDDPMIVQAVRRPDEQGGFVLRQAVGPGTTVMATDPADATAHVFDGRSARLLQVRYRSADALPIRLDFKSKEKRRVLLKGLPEVVVGVDADWGGRRYGFYPRPFGLDGKEKRFVAAPPFRASVGFRHNARPRYEHLQQTIDFRVFLTTPAGLLLKWDPGGIYTVAWEQILDGKVLASGSTKPPVRVFGPRVDPKRIRDLRYRLFVRGPGENRRVEVAAHHAHQEVRSGKVRVWSFPEVAGNARMWAACVSRAVAAYEATCPWRMARVDIERSMRMPPRLAGMGGYGGANGWVWIHEGDVYGFVGDWYWTGLLAHELGHVFHYGHGDPIQTKIMRQAGRRAGRKLLALRPGMARVPEGNRFRPLLEAVTNGSLTVEQEFGDGGDIELMRRTGAGHGGDGVLVPNLEITGDDAVFVWYWRSLFGGKPEDERRRHAAAWSWWLTCRGFADPEIQIALYSHAAGVPLGWLARLRGILVHDHRIAAAVDALGRAGKNLVLKRERDGIRHRWRTRRYAPNANLAAEEALMRGELGERHARVRALTALARESFRRGRPARGEKRLTAALVEARLGGPEALTRAIRECAVMWVAR